MIVHGPLFLAEKVALNSGKQHLAREVFISTPAERLLRAAQTLPEPLLAEVLDFAEFLHARQQQTQTVTQDRPLTAFCGGLQNCKAFEGDPLVIQQRLRDEWQ